MTIEACRKVSRGQVWFLVDNNVPAVYTEGSVIGKNRPWLVVSNNKCNQVSPVWTVVPLTSQSKSHLPTHVEYDIGDKHNTILCEQIRTVSAQVFFNTGSFYKYTLSEETMALVDEALAVQLGLSLVFPNAERYWASLEKLIRVRVKQAIADTKVEALDISKLATLLDIKVEAIVQGEVKPEPVVEEEKEEVVEEAKDEDVVEEDEETEETTPKKRRRWTEDEKREFIDYCNVNGAQQASKYYGMSVASVRVAKCKFSKELN